MFLREFTQPVRFVKGVGPRYALLLEKLGIISIKDLILHFPRNYIDRTLIDLLADGLRKETVNVIVRVISHDYIGWGRKRVLKAIIGDSSGQAALVCFGRSYMENILLVGKQFLVTGNFKYKYGELQSSSFQAESFDMDDDEYSKIIPVYPLTAGLSHGMMRKIVKAAFLAAGNRIDDEIPADIVRRYKLIPKADALFSVHFPENNTKLKEARRTLVYEELFYLELIIGRRNLSKMVARQSRRPVASALKKQLIERLPFGLTPDQVTAMEEIGKDLFSGYPMSRMLQGDVGCGKTLVALLASLDIIESGDQVAFMAPTELLARQHAENIARLTEPIGINVGFLSGSIKDEERRRLIKALADGDVQLLVGTHAVFSGDIVFNRLGFVIIDEQHRFGVLQRLKIMKKGENPDLLLMTATPIPRSLALTVFGDLAVSTIRTMPGGRKPVVTHLTKEGNEHRVYERVEREVSMGRQAYFVYPLIEESEKLDLKDALSSFEKLKSEVFPRFRFGLIHSRVPEDEKRRTMESFVQREIDILVSTSVVEVGVDVPNASAMVIEHAERFGLSALHQLRGRVGRAGHQSYAFLIYSNKLTNDGIERLKVMMETNDGFKIAEHDLKLRGPGEFLGTRQSGFFRLTIADLSRDRNLLLVARRDAFTLLEKDPGLLLPEHGVIRHVLEKVPPFADEFLEGG